MGCDIHLFPEVRVEGRWRFFPEVLPPCEHCGGKGRPQKAQGHAWANDDGTCGWCDGAGKNPQDLYHDRNYDVFAALANVRNYYDIPSITSDTRGLPEDASPEVKKLVSDRADHSQSWLTLDEVFEYDWQGTTIARAGVLDLATFVRWRREEDKPARHKKRHAGPKTWARSVGGAAVRVVKMQDALGLASRDSAEKARAMLACSIKPGEDIYVDAEWREPLINSSRRFLGRMESFRIKARSVGEARIVFGFDS